MDGIIVGVDESPYAADALRWAVEQAETTGRPITAVMGWGYIDQHHLEPDAPFDSDYSDDAAAKVLADLVTQAVGDGHHVTCRPVNDLPARAILESGQGADLVVVGARGLGGFKTLLLGSVSTQVLHGATSPVAVIRQSSTAHRAAGPVVVGVDGSGPGRRALAWAIEHAHRRDRTVRVVNAWHFPYVGGGFVDPWPSNIDFAGDADQFLRDELNAVDTREVIIERCPVPGRAGSALVEASKDASIVVIGARGHGRLLSATLGSVSDQVARHADCPVVVVP